MTNKKYILLSLILLIGLNTLVFLPSFSLVAKADHIAYLFETADFDHFKDLMLYSYSYPRTRLLLSGDRGLYRPIFYFTLAVQKYFFAYDFTLWQITAFLLHLLVIALLFLLLQQIRPGPFSLYVTLFFSLSYLSSDMVTWHHIAPYMICFIFILLALRHFLFYERGTGSRTPHLWLMILYLTLAGLTNEFGVIACLLFLVILWSRTKGPRGAKDHPAWLMLPLGLYSYLSLLDYWMRFSGFPFISSSTAVGLLPKILTVVGQFVTVLLLSLVLPFTPGLYLIHPGERNTAGFFVGEGLKKYLTHHQPMVFANALLLGLTALGVFLYIRDRRHLFFDSKQTLEANDKRPTATLALLCFALSFSYILLFVAFRTSGKTLSYLAWSLYQFYPITLFLLIGVYARISARQRGPSRSNQKFSALITVIICLATLLNAVRLYHLNLAARSYFLPWGRYMKQLNHFVQTHKQEPDFSIQFDHRDYVRPTAMRLGEGPKATRVAGNISDFLFRKYIVAKNAKYHLSYQNGRLSTAPRIKK